MVKNPPAIAEELGSTSELGRVPGEENGHGPWGRTESNMTERLTHRHAKKLSSQRLLGSALGEQ